MIAVCSCIGKLLSTMLLNRLIIHRDSSCPDPPNQAGFKKGSQCNDHILTLLTIMEKYKKTKNKVYAVFIDLRKAFDLVCRQALLFKLACYGVNGGFFDIIKSMYRSSTGHIKMNGKISEAFQILKGTEQGHPLSPELFKIYFQKLSQLLNEAMTDCPTLAGLRITHLAWADDLVVLSLDPSSIQKQLDIIQQYCRDWGLEINISKTKYMIMNGKDSCGDSWRPTLDGQIIEKVTSYCYLGVIISSNGKCNKAVESLYRKGLGAYFSLRSTIDRRFIKAKCSLKLFASLVEPILTYGCQTWLPTLPIISKLVSRFNYDGSIDLSSVAKMPMEQVQLRHLKYTLGISRRSSNSTAWGETGTTPLFFNCIKLCIKYLNRVMALPSSSFVKAALTEQIQLGLTWYKNMQSILECFGEVTTNQYQVNSSSSLNAARLLQLSPEPAVTNKLYSTFISSWKSSIENSSKLSFYCSVKNEFGWERYLDYAWKFQDRRATARIRCSSHKLNIEVGRYKNIPREDRKCEHCVALNVTNPAIEDENHMLHSCPLGDDLRNEFRVKYAEATASQPNSNIACIYLDIPRGSSTDETSSSSHQNTLSTSKEDTYSIQLSTRFISNIYRRTLNRKKELNRGPRINPTTNAIVEEG